MEWEYCAIDRWAALSLWLTRNDNFEIYQSSAISGTNIEQRLKAYVFPFEHDGKGRDCNHRYAEHGLPR